ncbi:HPP family protein [Desulfolithobacter sp.]
MSSTPSHSSAPGSVPPGPQGTLLFRVVRFLSRLQLRYLLPRLKHPNRAVRVFVFVEGSLALAIISAAALYTSFPLLFPPLGPSAFILFRMPMSHSAEPRTVLLSHLIGLASGFLALLLGTLLFATPHSPEPGVMNTTTIITLAMAMGFSSLAMIWLDCNHPPATATALIVAMGYITTVAQVVGFVVAVFLLICLAILFNRLLGGLPYSIWRHDPQIAALYGSLAGITSQKQNYWQQLTERMFHTRL